MDDAGLRHAMVETQIAARGIRDAGVLEAMREVPRHLFVPESLRADAYTDRPLAIGEGQTISQPFMVALMTEALGLRGTERVLEIGTGSGYQTAILARRAARIVSIERRPALAEHARNILATLGITTVEIVVADGTEGYPPQAPYDCILVTAGAPAIPDSLRDQLADGGRLVIPVGPAGFQRLTTVERTRGRFSTHEGEGCVFVPLVGRHGWPDSHR